MKADYHEVARQYSLLSAHYDDWSRIDWHDNVRQQGRALDELLKDKGFHGPCRVLDFTCGMGTQVTGLALHGHHVTGLDLSDGQVRRAQAEAQSFDLSVPVQWIVGDALQADRHVKGPFDVILSFGNSLPLLGSLSHIRDALRVMHGLLKPGGMILLSLMDYAEKRRTRPHVMQYGRVDNGDRQGIWMETAAWAENGCQYRSDVYFSFVSPEVKVVHYPFPVLYAIIEEEMRMLLAGCGFQAVDYKPKDRVPHFSCPLFMARKTEDVRQVQPLSGTGD